ncbi:DMT family transporter [Paraburkholderia sp. BR14374]|uniref:DMT family transporter n=1 Tax=Paraburkholderia sp. BR14374 TaxID=3237007 RepID=UPI0034CF6869
MLLKQTQSILNRKKLHGIAFMSAATFLFAVVDAIAKPISLRYPPNEIMFFRMLFGLAPAVFLCRFGMAQQKELKVHRFGGHFLRAVLALGSMGLFFAGLPHMPLATAVTLQYTEPIFISIFAIIFLSERFCIAIAVASAAGFIGVSLVSPPLSGSNQSLLAVTLIVLSAMFGAGSVIQIKKLSRTEEPAVIVLYFTIIATILSGLSLLVAWVTPSVEDLGHMALLGVAAGVGQLMLTIAFKNATASLLAPFSYFGVVWAIFFGYLFWSEVVSIRAALGSIVIIGGALYLGISNKAADETNAAA